MSLDKKKIQRINISLEQLFFCIYMLFTFLLVCTHEQWEDELQAWCIAQSLSIPEIFYQMRYEGHFALWHLLLKPLTVLHFPVFFMGILSWILCLISAYLFMVRSQFPIIVKSLILISCPVLYYFPVIARNYALIPLILTGLAMYYPVRLRKPWHYGSFLILLVHTHAYMCGLAGILGVFFAWELLKRPNKYKSFAVLVMISLGVLAAFLQVAPAFGSTSVAPANFSDVLAVKGLFSKIGKSCYLLADLHCEYSIFKHPLPGILIYYAALLLGWFGLLWRDKKIFTIFFFAVFWQILFSSMIYPFGLQRVYLPFLILIFCYALPTIQKRTTLISAIRVSPWLRDGYIALGVLAILTIPATGYFIKNDISKPFSNLQHMANYIQKNVPADAKIVVFPDTLITGTFGAYIPGREFHRSTDNKPFTLFCMPRGPLPGKLDQKQLAIYAGKRSEFYILFQFGAYISYQLPYNQEIFHIGDFCLKIETCTLPAAFFSAGENYILLKVTRK